MSPEPISASPEKSGPPATGPLGGFAPARYCWLLPLFGLGTSMVLNFLAHSVGSLLGMAGFLVFALAIVAGLVLSIACLAKAGGDRRTLAHGIAGLVVNIALVGLIIFMFFAVAKVRDIARKAEAQRQQGTAGPAVQQPDPEFLPGRGVEVGSFVIDCCGVTRDGSVVYRTMSNSYIRADSLGLEEKLLAAKGVKLLPVGGAKYVVGNPAAELAAALGKGAQCGMSHGVLRPEDEALLPLYGAILAEAMGTSSRQEELCVYAVPSQSPDGNVDVAYHKDALGKLFARLGYKSQALSKGHAVVYAELANDDFTGVAVHCDMDAISLCVAYKTVSVADFSSFQAGTWAEQEAAKTLGTSAPVSRGTGRGSGNLANPIRREDEVLANQYRTMVRQALHHAKQLLNSNKNLSPLAPTVDVVCAGELVQKDGFVDLFGDEWSKAGLPLKAKAVRRASDPAHAVSQGCLILAQSLGEPQPGAIEKNP